jgi:hypothetical protein
VKWGTQEQRDKTSVLVVVQVQEVSLEEKTGVKEAFANVSTQTNNKVAERSTH